MFRQLRVLTPLFKWTTKQSLPVPSQNFHLVNQQIPTTNLLECNRLKPSLAELVAQQRAGIKNRVVLNRRCKDCYFVRRDGRLFVMCKTHPRHKQMQIVPKEKHTWIVTDAMQSKVRSW